MAHPRSRGERTRYCRHANSKTGSSPLTRGAPGALFTMGASNRLIPAHAGSTCVPDPRPRRHPAHPRSRGEHSSGEGATSRMSGSSPLTRGALASARAPLGRERLIPAHAGSTVAVHGGSTGAWAHPRSRGEHSWREVTPGACCGSSPLTRGALVVGEWVGVVDGLIPAHAGSTS